MKIYTHIKKILADIHTPVSIYSLLRDQFRKPLLLESSDYFSREGHYSYICLNPMADIQLNEGSIIINKNGKQSKQKVINRINTLSILKEFRKEFEFERFPFKFCYAGLFGYTGYDSIKYFEDINIKNEKQIKIPDLFYSVYSLILVFEHQTGSLFIVSHSENPDESKKNLEIIEQKLSHTGRYQYPFYTEGKVQSELNDVEFLKLTELAKHHCKIGDVFQLVLSKRFSQRFSGDEFNVYRALKNINPSPYLFYFDLGNFKIFGSSPEAQLIVHNQEMEIHPIAGTYRRTGNDYEDAIKAGRLTQDPKEKSEHMMLVDLARNDVSKYCTDVIVAELMQTHFYSHVIHLVSKVKGKIKSETNPFELITGTFPAGTLTGAPKHKAMQLIDLHEPFSREFYGGCIGYISHDDSINHAIMIRTILSKDNVLYLQAGAGIVISSSPASENQEVSNKTDALRQAIQTAENFNNITKELSHEIISIG